ncbi:hypothetical protein D3C75_809250 [compost metagenome]
MAKLIRSARGTQVDFDLVLIKQQIAANAAPTNVQARDDFIENKIRRRTRRVAKVGEAPVAARELGEEVTTVTHLDLDEPEEFQEPLEEDLLEEPVVQPVKK